MSDKQRVLLCGDVEGRFKLFFKKIDTVNKKSGPFDFLLCVGDFFGKKEDDNDDTELVPFIKGNKTIPVPTFIVIGGSDDERMLKRYNNSDTTQGVEICPNLVYLGKQGLYTASSGLKIAYLGGTERQKKNSKEKNRSDDAGDEKQGTFDAGDVTALRNSCIRNSPDFRGVDVLLTSQWPTGITNYDNNNKQQFDCQGSSLISWLATQIRPRYHVCGLENVHYERPPYR